MDHGRRARLLRAGEELRCERPLRDSRRGRRRLVRLRLPAADQPGVPAVRLGAGRLCRREGDQLGGHVARRGARVLPRASRAEPAVLPRRGGAVGCDPVAALHGDADDRERVLPRLPLRRARPRAHAGEAHDREPARRSRALRARLRDAAAGARAVPGGADGAARCSGCDGLDGFARFTSPRARSWRLRSSSRRRAEGRLCRCSAPTRARGGTATRSAPSPSGCSGTSRSSTCISASFPSRRSSCSRSRGGASTRRSVRSRPAPRHSRAGSSSRSPRSRRFPASRGWRSATRSTSRRSFSSRCCCGYSSALRGHAPLQRRRPSLPRCSSGRCRSRG